MQKEYFDTSKKVKKEGSKEYIVEDNKELLAKIEKSYTDLKALSEEKIVIIVQLSKQIEISAKSLDGKIAKAEVEFKDSYIKDDEIFPEEQFAFSSQVFSSRLII